MGTKWGVCATIKAPTDDILNFAAHYLDAGAHRVWVYLDAPDPVAHGALKAHPKCRVTTCDDAYWRRVFGRRPNTHQTRQTRNATRTYARAGDVDWLLHADVDEFLISGTPVSENLAGLPAHTMTARVRPIEVLARETALAGRQAFKRAVPAGARRAKTVKSIYPTYGTALRGGFISHTAGKVFLRTDQPDIIFRIHNAFQRDIANPAQVTLDSLSLAHVHAPDWGRWRAHLDYRLARGSYRADLGPGQRKQGGDTLHDTLSAQYATKGEEGLRAFFDEVCRDTPQLRARLAAAGLLEEHDLDLDAKRHLYFGDKRAEASTV